MAADPIAGAPGAAPADQPQRDRICGDLGTTLFVEAGAGSGKTTTLVDRIFALVTEGGIELAAIAAITFTEKAAAELRDRIRRRLEEAAAGDDEAGRRCRRALDQLDGAAIATLHSFAQRILSEHPIEAGIPPRLEVLDEVTSGVEFERRWTAFRDELLDDPDLERTILPLLACGVPHGALRALAVAFEDNWDLVAERVPAVGPEPPGARAVLEEALAAVDAVCAARRHCVAPGDSLRRRLDEIAAYAGILRSASAGDGLNAELAILDALNPKASPAPPSFSAGGIGRKANWRTDLPTLREQVKQAGAGLGDVRRAVAVACAQRIGAVIRRFTLGAADERRRSGRLEFHDLLVLARALLRDPEHGPSVRTRLHQRYQRLLLDEFQDTDPIQIELAVRIAAGDPGGGEAGARHWADVPVGPGRLFVVGDPKQSIYRFRRADIATFLTAQATFGARPGGGVVLTANFRSVSPVVEWVNHVFSALMSEAPELDVPVPSQPPYVGIEAHRPPSPSGPAVAVLGRQPHPKGSTADAIRAAEAAEVAATVGRAVAEKWSVADPRAPGEWRAARLGDITVLVPARTSLPFLENALEAAALPYRAESSSLVYATRAVRDVVMVLRAVDDPTDHLRIVSALRTPLLACGDDDLFRFKVERRGRWSYLSTQPSSVPDDDPVRAGLAYLRALHDLRQWSAPSELLEKIVRDRRALELGFADGRPRDVWRRLRFLVDQARAWSDATGGSLRQYLRWVELQSAEGARMAEAVLPETDDDAVRIMTIHAAKGLEFPITIVSGLSTVPQARAAPAEVVFPPAPATVGYRLAGQVTTPEYDAWKPIDEQMGFDERIRLLYVACTRARDHLVVSLHRKVRASSPPKPTARTNAELVVAGMGPMLDALPDGAPSDGDEAPQAVATATAPPSPIPAFRAWADERATTLARASIPTVVAATALTDDETPDAEGNADPDADAHPRSVPAVDTTGGPGEPDADPGLRKRPRDLDLPPWLKGRYGTAVGRAVHGVLQAIDLAGGTGLDAAVAAQCEAEAVPDRADDVRRLAEAALRSPSVREAAGCAHWREVYACTPVAGDRLLEGYVDLLYRTPEGLVIVDHKTASTADPAELDRRVEAYRLQGASYAVAVGAATAEDVVRVTFVFLTPEGAVERHLDDLPGSMDRVRELVAAGREMTTD
ncbi:MAG TPA: UvrD-helicase domain-containing protein [Acidimicrobiales bacterium]|nr:UvrD-helicase domain-containing protein [Acidimicrobiales bacterium]